jgi:hypothetical protein
MCRIGQKGARADLFHRRGHHDGGGAVAHRHQEVFVEGVGLGHGFVPCSYEAEYEGGGGNGEAEK